MDNTTDHNRHSASSRSPQPPSSEEGSVDRASEFTPNPEYVEFMYDMADIHCETIDTEKYRRGQYPNWNGAAFLKRLRMIRTISESRGSDLECQDIDYGSYRGVKAEYDRSMAHLISHIGVNSIIEKNALEAFECGLELRQSCSTNNSRAQPHSYPDCCFGFECIDEEEGQLIYITERLKDISSNDLRRVSTEDHDFIRNSQKSWEDICRNIVKGEFVTEGWGCPMM